MMYPSTAPPLGNVDACHRTATPLPETATAGVSPPGIVVAAAAASPVPPGDQAARAGPAVMNIRAAVSAIVAWRRDLGALRYLDPDI
jgi:hypothetical protein